MKKTVLTILALAILAGGGYLAVNMTKKSADTQNAVQSPTAPPISPPVEPGTEVPAPPVSTNTRPIVPMAKTFNFATIAQHATRSDCWIAVYGKVYDVTEYVMEGKHPGGDAIIKGCGKDATSIFEAVPKHMRNNAIRQADPYYIGDLAP